MSFVGEQERKRAVIAIELERLPLLQIAHGLEEGLEAGLFVKHVLAAVPAVDDVIESALLIGRNGRGLPRVYRAGDHRSLK